MNLQTQKWKFLQEFSVRDEVKHDVQLKNYFLDKSPSAAFVTDYPQNVHDDDVMSEAETKPPDTIKEKRMMEAKIQMQDQVTTNQKEIMFDAEIEMQDKVPQKRCSQQVHDDDDNDDAGAKKMAKLDAERQQPADTTIITTQDKEMLDANIQITVQDAKIHMQDEAITKQKAMFEAHIQMQDEAIAKQKALFEAKLHMQDQVNTKHGAMFEDERQMQDHVITKQKVMFEAKIQMLDSVIAEQKAKIQIQDNVIAEQKERIQMIEVAKLNHEKLITYVINPSGKCLQ
ncbi:uncharacterized protein [Rutidosis leptorrhynchoides]|uniref:uncharacterized protein n=1 Tax=Rutidosis leptorrhynchoides TaxID=125765 RepID=UPI003A99A846